MGVVVVDQQGQPQGVVQRLHQVVLLGVTRHPLARTGDSILPDWLEEVWEPMEVQLQHSFHTGINQAVAEEAVPSRVVQLEMVVQRLGTDSQGVPKEQQWLVPDPEEAAEAALLRWVGMEAAML